MVLSVVLLIIGMAYLSFSSNDYFFAGHLQNDTRAYYLAYAGMQYYTAQGLPPSVNGVPTLQLGDTQHLCLVVTSGTNLVFEGEVTDGFGRVLSKCSLTAPGGNLARWYEATR